MYNHKNKKSIRQYLIFASVRNSNIILQAKALEVHNNPFVYILRVIGGLSIMAVLLNIIIVFLDRQPLFIYPSYLIILFLALFHIIYIISINIVKIYYIVYCLQVKLITEREKVEKEMFLLNDSICRAYSDIDYDQEDPNSDSAKLIKAYRETMIKLDEKRKKLDILIYRKKRILYVKKKPKDMISIDNIVRVNKKISK